jgi:carbamoyl-phosphate synthase large subunit
MKTELTIAVTGLNAIDSPGPGVGVIRALKASKSFQSRIIGLSYESLEPGIYLHDLVDKTYQIPYPSAGSDQLFSRLQYIQQKENIDVVIPNFDAELGNFIRLAPKLNEMGINTFMPDNALLEQLDKMHLHEFGQKYGFKVPETRFITGPEDLEKMEDEIAYPVMVKGKYYEAFPAYQKDQLINYYHKLNAKWGLPVVLQEVIKGTEIDVLGLGDGNGNLIGAIPMRKLYITDKGKAWSGVTLEDPELLKITSEFAAHSKWRGGFELEFIRTDKNQFYLLEVNPRFPAWVYTCVAAGQNMPEALVKMAMGEQVLPYSDYHAGKMFIRYAWEIVTDIEEFQKISALGEL